MEDRRLLATVVVNTPLDTVDLNDGVTSLREALFVANLLSGPDTIEFDFVHDGPATILLKSGELKITDAVTIHGTGASLLTIDASGNDPTPDVHNADGSRVFDIDNGNGERIAVTISGVTLTGGDVNGTGGAIRSRENLTVRASKISGNAAHSGTGGGGGISNNDGILNISENKITDNYCTLLGGGIESTLGSLVATNCVISENRARSGAGIGLGGGNGTAEVTACTISNNRGMFGGGGIGNSATLVVHPA